MKYPIQKLGKRPVFPNPEYTDHEGLIAYGGDLSVNRLVMAYAMGIFPWYTQETPILWWSPDPRAVMFLDKYKPPKSLIKIIEKQIFEVRYDTNFEAVIWNCANIQRKEDAGTWITPEMQTAYINLHNHKIAHSVEIYHENTLVGGLYGVAIGRYFSGESMFNNANNASKTAFYYLVEKLRAMNFLFIDIQQDTPHFMKWGGENLKRTDFLKLITQAIDFSSKPQKW